MRHSAFLGALASTLLAGAAVAQTPPPPPPGSNPPGGGPVYNFPQGQMDNAEMARRFETDAWRLETEQRLAAEDPERVDLARRVAALTDAGQCAEARALARSEGDRQMALRVRQTCRSRQ